MRLYPPHHPNTQCPTCSLWGMLLECSDLRLLLVLATTVVVTPGVLPLDTASSVFVFVFSLGTLNQYASTDRDSAASRICSQPSAVAPIRRTPPFFLPAYSGGPSRRGFAHADVEWANASPFMCKAVVSSAAEMRGRR
jgi:hypothetical protein